jgi:dCMP deaminase
MRPCFNCIKELLQAKIRAVYYLHDWNPSDSDLNAEYDKIQARFPGGIRQLEMEDPDEEWAVSKRRQKPLAL